MATTAPNPTPAANSAEDQILNALQTAAPLVETGLTLVGQGGAAAAIATIEQLVAASLRALAAAKGTPVTAEAVLALAPAAIALPAPTE